MGHENGKFEPEETSVADRRGKEKPEPSREGGRTYQEKLKEKGDS